MQPNASAYCAELDVFVTDLNGQQRGKRLVAQDAQKIQQEGFKLPRSVMGLDFWGDDVLANGLVFETGDSDGICRLISEELLPVPWSDAGHLQALATMFNPDGSPFLGDPRQILAAVLARYQAKGLTPVVAAELEFYLLDIESDRGQPKASVWAKPQPFARPDAYAMQDLDAFRPLLADLRQACQVLHIPADSVIAEFGECQFEFNLKHGSDALQAADQTVLFKRVVKHIARQHGHCASFMAKTFGERSGSGFHLHFSVLDQQGKNIFANGQADGSELLKHAVAGLLQAMPDSMLIFAPHLNSYRRLQPGTHAPTAVNWGYENRTVSIRIPDSPDVARRIEHRVAGADANPYLVFAAVLSAALYGIEQQLPPIPKTEGNAYAKQQQAQEGLPCQWLDAIQRLQHSSLLAELMGELFVKVFCAAKAQEYQKFARHVTEIEYTTYLGPA